MTSAPKSPRATAQMLWHQARVKRLVRGQLGSGSACLVYVQEIICDDPGCPGPATLIRIVALDFRETRLLIHKPLAEVAAQDIAEAL